MASEQQVRHYLAYWFQLGKKLFLNNGQETILPRPVMRESCYSSQFETCWQQVIAQQGQDCYLEGTNITIQELLSSAWDIESCARCEMPVPVVNSGISDPECPCSDLPNWPNFELPSPRMPVNSISYLNRIKYRLIEKD